MAKSRRRKCWLCAVAKKENHKLKREALAFHVGEQPFDWPLSPQASNVFVDNRSPAGGAG